jgi:hypothetical protein
MADTMTITHAGLDVVAEHFRPVIGRPAWQVRRGHGSFLTLEFGEPTLTVHDPQPRKTRADQLGPLRRLAVVHGEWHLWIYSCIWKVFQDDRLFAHSEASDAEIADAIVVLDGQILQAVSLVENTAQTIFPFDLGGRLTTEPYGDDSKDEQWFLYEPGNIALAVRADARYSVEPRDRASDAEWRVLWPRPGCGIACAPKADRPRIMNAGRRRLCAEAIGCSLP